MLFYLKYAILCKKKKKNCQSLLLSLNIGKTFNRLHWGYLRMLLRKFGLTSLFRVEISALYTKPNAGVWTSTRTFFFFIFTWVGEGYNLI